ncbi:site-2 protease family protein [Candidatus Woesearchaeota archaeon]|nr:site-2 protease family protein [Candidatus Woesearchaeota archaeon]
MIDFETIAAIIFVVALTIILSIKRKKLDTKQLIPYFLYFSMYRTKLGLRMMDSWAKKYRKFTVYLGYSGILVGFVGMALIAYSLINNLYTLFKEPEAVSGVGLVLPFEGKGIFYVPFFYWIISIFVIAVVHEFSHGLVARAHDLKVKSSGFAFLGLIIPIIPAAFVEPDEKMLRKRPHKEQLSVFAAGPLANIITAFICLGILSFALSPLANAFVEPNGIKITGYVKEKGLFPAEASGIKIGEVIKDVDNIQTTYVKNLSDIMKAKKPNDIVVIKTDKSSYQVKLARNPENESLAYIGAFLEQDAKIKDSAIKKYGKFLPNALIWTFGLFAILFILNLGIGLFNLVPIGPLDGGRMLQLPLQKYFGEEKGNRIFGVVSLIFLVIILVNLGAGFGLLKLFS